ncbi:patatin family protein [uncultured Dubosiella sp.]|jgi:predicted patatin/cPLA2 family phospholipase|uniref:patatin-like phospholipase family protein n=1 Tax=uncultured Dubosiella sp. TaxID=1937011 RepID=UPI000EE62E9B|nr:patatin family protein [uncultured Dubosiella sp.]GJM58356.1 patatin family protein [Erysipelotrichaceae bacterium OPF54]HAM31544.1 patatin family protein [Erysipelotrichaceae bacterium]
MKNVSIVAEGGGTKIAYSAGVLKCLLEENILVPYCVGISAGAEVLLPYVSRQIHRLEVTGIDSPSQKGAVGFSALMKEGSIFGIESTNNYIEKEAPLDFDTFYNSSTQMDTGLYNIHDHTIEYFDKSYVDKSMTLIKASCALLLLTKPYDFRGKKYFDAGLVDMISVRQAEKHGCEKHIIISTKEEGYVRKPAPKYQLWLTKMVYKDDQIVDDLRHRHERYNEQWDHIAQLEKEGKALVLRPHKDMGISRYTTDPKKLKPWFQLGYDETKARIDEIKAFVE